MELSDIKKSISDMDDAELRELLSSIRQSRRTSKRPPSTRKAKPKGEVSANVLMEALSPEQIQLLLKQMGG